MLILGVTKSDTVVWEPCGELNVNDIKAHNQAVINENSLEFIIGNIVIKHLPLSKAISEAVNTGSGKNNKNTKT